MVVLTRRAMARGTSQVYGKQAAALGQQSVSPPTWATGTLSRRYLKQDGLKGK